MAPSHKSARLGHDLEPPRKEKQTEQSASSSSRSHGGRNRPSGSIGTSVSRDAPAATASAPTDGQNNAYAEESKSHGLQWAAFDRDVLHAYRREFRLETPTSFAKSFHHVVLSQPGGVGRYSPTMARRRGIRRQSKEQLARTIRRHFNAMGVQEDDVIAELLCNLGRERSEARQNPVFSWSAV